jgi:hypothetical protein
VSIAELRRLAPAPAWPLGSGDEQRWLLAENKLGLRLPTDYKDLVQTYGSGRFGNFLTVFTPFVSDGYVNLLTQDTLALDAYREVRAALPHAAPYPAYPEPGGVLPWAQTDNGDVVYWLTEGPSDSWPIVVIEARHGSYEQYALSTTEFLARLLEGTLNSRILPARLGGNVSPRFAPLTS